MNAAERYVAPKACASSEVQRLGLLAVRVWLFVDDGMEAELHWALQGVPAAAGTSTTGESPERKALSKPGTDSKGETLPASSIIRMRMRHGWETPFFHLSGRPSSPVLDGAGAGFGRRQWWHIQLEPCRLNGHRAGFSGRGLCHAATITFLWDFLPHGS
jgi:hypothetical protein